MRKVNKTPKVTVESRMACRDGLGSSAARPAIYVYEKYNIIEHRIMLWQVIASDRGDGEFRGMGVGVF